MVYFAGVWPVLVMLHITSLNGHAMYPQATQTAEQLFKSISTMLAGETLSGVFAAWRDTTKRMARLRLVLQKVLGRYMQLAFYGWR